MNVDLAEFLVSALAVYGLSYAMTTLEGPFSIFARIRGKTAMQRNWIERGLHCVICVSCWVGLAMAILARGMSREALVQWQGYLGFSVIATVVLNRLRKNANL